MSRQQKVTGSPAVMRQFCNHCNPPHQHYAFPQTLTTAAPHKTRVTREFCKFFSSLVEICLISVHCTPFRVKIKQRWSNMLVSGSQKYSRVLSWNQKWISSQCWSSMFVFGGQNCSRQSCLETKNRQAGLLLRDVFKDKNEKEKVGHCVFTKLDRADYLQTTSETNKNARFLTSFRIKTFPSIIDSAQAAASIRTPIHCAEQKTTIQFLFEAFCLLQCTCYIELFLRKWSGAWSILFNVASSPGHCWCVFDLHCNNWYSCFVLTGSNCEADGQSNRGQGGHQLQHDQRRQERKTDQGRRYSDRPFWLGVEAQVSCVVLDQVRLLKQHTSPVLSRTLCPVLPLQQNWTKVVHVSLNTSRGMCTQETKSGSYLADDNST